MSCNYCGFVGYYCRDNDMYVCADCVSNVPYNNDCKNCDYKNDCEIFEINNKSKD